MTLRTDLEAEVKSIYETPWTRRKGQVVPEDSNIGLGNDGVDLEITILYADLSASTKLVDNFQDDFAAENYKTYLRCAAKIIRAEGGHIRSYDGDRVMGVFIGSNKNTSAVRCALKINWAVKNVIDPAKKKQYPNTKYVMKHVVGVDSTHVLAVRPGIRGSNDIAWIGKAANHAAKLSSLPSSHQTRITDKVYDSMNDSVKFSSGKNMWEKMQWNDMNKRRIYRSTYSWRIS